MGQAGHSGVDLLAGRENKAMKRTPLKRKSPMKRSREHAKSQAEWQRMVICAILISRGRCRANILGKCTWWATEGHHIAGRGVGKNVPSNCLPVCAACHRWIESNRKRAMEMGFSRPRNQQQSKG